MKAIIPLIHSALRVEAAAAKAEKIADEIIFAYVFPYESSPHMSETKALYYARAGIHAMAYLRKKSKKKTRAVFLQGDALAEITKFAEKEKADIIIAQSWHRSETKVVQSLSDQQVPLITIFNESAIDPTPLRHPFPMQYIQKSPSQKKIEEKLIDLSKTCDSAKSSGSNGAHDPADWASALEYGPALSIYFRTGMINEEEYLEKLIWDYSNKKLDKVFFNEKMKRILKMYFILLKYPELHPLKEEWWAERDFFEKEKIQAQCITEIIEKLETNGYLENTERVLLVSYLGHHLRIKSQAILPYLERNLLDYEDRICKYNLYGVLGLLEHAHVVSKNYAREHRLCVNCDQKIGYCTLKKGYADWVTREEKHKTTPELTSFDAKDE